MSIDSSAPASQSGNSKFERLSERYLPLFAPWFMASAMLVLSMIIYYDWKFPPHGYQWPIFLAPAITLLIATLAFVKCAKVEHMRLGVLLWCVAGAFVTFWLCTFLSHFHSWQRHLVWLLLLFVIFIVWDWGIIKMAQSEEFKKEVRSGNRYVNLPTIAVIGIIYLALKFFIPEGFVDTNANPTTFASTHDAFVSGVVTFHLIVSSMAYGVAPYICRVILGH
jgi:hypothetical protein